MFATMCLFHEIFMKSRTEGAAFCMTLDARLSLSLSARPLVLCATFIYFSFSESCSDRGERERKREREREGEGGGAGTGIFKGADGSVYDGGHKDGLVHGQGTRELLGGAEGGL